LAQGGCVGEARLQQPSAFASLMKVIVDRICNNLLHFVRGLCADRPAGHESSRGKEFLEALSTTLRSDEDVMAWLQQQGFEQAQIIEFMPLSAQRDNVAAIIAVVPVKAGDAEFVQREGWHIEEKHGEFFLPLDQPKLSKCGVGEFASVVDGDAANCATKLLRASGVAHCLVHTRKFACGNLVLKFQMLWPELSSGQKNPDFIKDQSMTWTIKIDEGKGQKEMRICWVDNKAALLPWSPTGCASTRQRMLMEPMDLLPRTGKGSAARRFPVPRCPKRNMPPVHLAEVPNKRVDLLRHAAAPHVMALRQRCRCVDDAVALCGGSPSSPQERSSVEYSFQVQTRCRLSGSGASQSMERPYRRGTSRSMPGMEKCRRSSCRSSGAIFRRTLSGIEEVSSSHASESSSQKTSRLSSSCSSQKTTRLSRDENLRRPMRGVCDMHI